MEVPGSVFQFSVVPSSAPTHFQVDLCHVAELCDIAANINIIPSLSPSHFKIKRLRKLFYLDAGLYNGLAGKRFPHNKEKYCKIEKNFF